MSSGPSLFIAKTMLFPLMWRAVGRINRATVCVRLCSGCFSVPLSHFPLLVCGFLFPRSGIEPTLWKSGFNQWAARDIPVSLSTSQHPTVQTTNRMCLNSHVYNTAPGICERMFFPCVHRMLNKIDHVLGQGVSTNSKGLKLCTCVLSEIN